jgi:hypothetical protein
MSQDRFVDILGMLHLNDNEQQVCKGQAGYDTSHKIWLVLQMLAKNVKMYTCQNDPSHLMIQCVFFRSAYSFMFI